jgi:hypothetical protein
VGKVINLEGGQGLGIRVLGAFNVPIGNNGQPPDLKLYAAVVESVLTTVFYLPRLMRDSATFRYKGIFYEDESQQSNGDYSAY